MSNKDNINDNDYKDFFNSIIEQPAENATPVSELVKRKMQEDYVEPVKFQTPTLPSPEVSINLPSANPIIRKRKEAMRDKEIQKLNSSRVYEDVVLESLPMARFYLAGTRILYRDLTVKEIENYSSMDEGNLFDFKEKLEDILDSATLFIHADGTYGTCADIKDGDKPWMIYLIREKTFGKGANSKGAVLTIDVKEDNEVYPIEINTDNIEIYRDEEIMDWYNAELACFVFETELQPEPFYIAPPTIGLKNCFDQYLKIKLRTIEASEINKQFFRIAPFLQPHITYISYEELVEFEEWFENDMTPDTFSFLYDLFENHMLIGIRGLKKNVEARTIRTDSVYPFSFKAIFVLPNAFRVFGKKQNRNN